MGFGIRGLLHRRRVAIVCETSYVVTWIDLMLICSANRIPEKLYPGKFDYFFASHQIFHVCVVLAALAHYASILTALNHWHSQPGVCPN